MSQVEVAGASALPSEGGTDVAGRVEVRGADTVNHGPIYTHFPDSNLGALARSTSRLAELADAVRLVFVHHYGYGVAYQGFLGEVARGVAEVEAGEAALVPARDILGGPCLEARFERFSVTLPDPSAPPAVLTTDA